MSSRSRAAAAGLLVLLASACSQEAATDPGPSELERVERLADDAPAVLIARVKDAYAKTVMRVSVRRLSSEQDDPYTFVADQAAWRVETPAPEGDEGGEGDGLATLLVSDDELCFDEEFRPVLSSAVAMSYGFVDFDPEPWSCTAVGFGLNPGHPQLPPRGPALAHRVPHHRPELCHPRGGAGGRRAAAAPDHHRGDLRRPARPAAAGL